MNRLMIHRSRGTDYTAVAKGTAVAEDRLHRSRKGDRSRGLGSCEGHRVDFITTELLILSFVQTIRSHI
jgi:hypothetical protein